MSRRGVVAAREAQEDARERREKDAARGTFIDGTGITRGSEKCRCTRECDERKD